MNWSITFHPNYRVFQNLTTGRMIGNVEEGEGLYFLDPKERKYIQAFISEMCGKQEKEIWL